MTQEDFDEVFNALEMMLRMAGIREDEPMWNEEDYKYACHVYNKWLCWRAQ